MVVIWGSIRIWGPRLRFVLEYRVKIGFQDHESSLGLSRLGFGTVGIVGSALESSYGSDFRIRVGIYIRARFHGVKLVFGLSRVLGFGIENPIMIMSLTPVSKPNSDSLL